MYTVIKEFVDLKDNRHKYMAGDVYPRHGIEVDKDRVVELMGRGNMAHTPLIRESIERGFSLPTEGILEADPGVSPTSLAKRKEKPRKKQEKHVRTDS